MWKGLRNDKVWTYQVWKGVCDKYSQMKSGSGNNRHAPVIGRFIRCSRPTYNFVFASASPGIEKPFVRCYGFYE